MEIQSMNRKSLPIDTIGAAELAKILQQSERTVVNNMTRAPQFLPPFRRVGRRAVWIKDDVLDWLRCGRSGHANQSSNIAALVRAGRPPNKSKIGGAA
jgi:predicted DNA-binding transcriptional regulator AlpA